MFEYFFHQKCSLFSVLKRTWKKIKLMQFTECESSERCKKRTRVYKTSIGRVPAHLVKKMFDFLAVFDSLLC